VYGGIPDEAIVVLWERSIPIRFYPYSFKRDWYYACNPAIDWFPSGGPTPSRTKISASNILMFRLSGDQPGAVPHWFLVALTALPATLVVLPWLRWRFSLRTLLIATTVVAAILGLLVYAVRR
jgi:hypothetical protein